VSFAVSTRIGGEEVVEYRLAFDCGVLINEIWVLWACEVPILFGSEYVQVCDCMIIRVQLIIRI
jgi:hypothetical protein